MSDYAVDIDGLTYRPVPESWRDHPSAVDTNSGRPRLFAVSIAVDTDLRELVVRYAHPDSEQVVAIHCAAHFDEDDGTVGPAAFAEGYGTWARSVVAPPGLDAEDVMRAPEIDHFDTLWGDRLGLGEDGHRAVADGGDRRA